MDFRGERELTGRAPRNGRAIVKAVALFVCAQHEPGSIRLVARSGGPARSGAGGGWLGGSGRGSTGRQIRGSPLAADMIAGNGQIFRDSGSLPAAGFGRHSEPGQGLDRIGRRWQGSCPGRPAGALIRSEREQLRGERYGRASGRGNAAVSSSRMNRSR
jgi:hypothetical protein